MATEKQNRGSRNIRYDVSICYSVCSPEVATQKTNSVIAILRSAYARNGGEQAVV